MSEPRWRRYLRFWTRDISADVDDELQFHFAHRVEQYRQAGMSQAEAEAAAAAQFGDVNVIRARLVGIDTRIARTSDVARWLDAFSSDLRTSIRSLGRQPAFAAAVIVTLALGLGANAAMFSFLDRLFFRPPAGVADASALRRFWTVERDKSGPVAYRWRASIEEYKALASSLRDDARLALYSGRPYTYVDRDERPVVMVRASADYLPLLGVRASIGRLFGAEEAAIGAPAPVAVVSDDLWRSKYGGDSSVIGKRMSLNGGSYTIIGVAQPGFTGVDLERTDIWIPFGERANGNEPIQSGGGVTAFVVARLARGVTDESVEARATAIMRHASFGDSDSLTVLATGSIVDANGPGRTPKQYLLPTRLGGVSLTILIIACANIVNLLLARTVARRREIAVRVAMGVSRGRLIWLLALPAILLSVVAGVAALASAAMTGAVLRAELLPDINFADSPFHWRLLVFTMLAALIAGVVSGIVPAIQGSRADITTFLKSGAQTGTVQRSLLRAVLLAIQVALSLVLLVGAGLFLRSTHNVESIRIGYDVPSILFAYPEFEDWRSGDSVTIAATAERIRRVRGVGGVGLSGMVPFGGTYNTQFYIGRDSARTNTKGDRPSMAVVSPNYFSVTGIRIARGRDFAPDPAGWSIVVNETMAREYWPNDDPIGKCIRLNKPTSPCHTVVGISEDAHVRTVIEEANANFYVALAHPPLRVGGGVLVIRADPDQMATVIGATRRILREAFPTARPYTNRLEDEVAYAYRPFRQGSRLFSIFGLLALIVATVGVYSAVSYTVTQRIHEFGVRIALGANVSRLLGSVVRPALAPVAIGMVAGAGIALVSGRLIASLLYGVTPSDPLVMLSGAFILVVAAALAVVLPARRAASVDPMIALRAE